jgi:tRNA A37 methylthiotransferase MiaB
MKRYHPKMTVTTDIIIGYPGETDEDIRETIDFLCKSRFDTVHIFLYNEVPTAASFTVEPKVPGTIAMQRIDKIEKALENARIDNLVMV